MENLNIDKNYYISIEKILKLIIHDIENIKDSYDQTSFDKKLNEFQDLVKINNTQLENKWVSYINNEITKFDNLYQILEIINDSEKKEFESTLRNLKTFQNNKPNSQTSTEEFVNIFDFLRKKGSNLNLENDINEFFKKIIKQNC